MHDRPDELTRREFTLESALALLSGVTIAISGCGGSDGSSGGMTTGPTPPPAANQSEVVEGQVSSNHGHRVVIERAQLTAGNDIVVDISGDAGHPHSVELSATELQQIASGVQVAKSSTVLQADPGLYAEVETHGHTVTFN